MTTFKLEISTDNAAFEDPEELPLLLRQVANWAAAGEREHGIVDTNGNTVGRFWIEDDAGDSACWADLLERLPTLSEAQAANLKVDRDELRVWLARTGLEDGEPFARTVYVEALDSQTGRWGDVGYYDGDEPDPTPWPSDAATAYEVTRSLTNEQ